MGRKLALFLGATVVALVAMAFAGSAFGGSRNHDQHNAAQSDDRWENEQGRTDAQGDRGHGGDPGHGGDRGHGGDQGYGGGQGHGGDQGHPRPMAYTCTGGARSGPDPSMWTFVSIPSNTYASLTVTGVCQTAPGAVIHVLGDVDVAAGAVLDAQSAPSTITVGHNVTAAAGSLLGLGCQPDYPDKTGHPCAFDATANSSITVDGNVTGTDVDTALLNGVTVDGSVTLTGGGGDIPWSIKNNKIGRDLTVSGVTADWLGVLFNEIEGSVTLTAITVNDPEDLAQGLIPLVFVVRNDIERNLSCTGLAPGVSGGFFGPPDEVNVVGGNATGQCASLVAP